MIRKLAIKNFLIAVSLLSCQCTIGQQTTQEINIIPLPQKAAVRFENFDLDQKTEIEFSDSSVYREVLFLQSQIERFTGLKLNMVYPYSNSLSRISVLWKDKNESKEEAYRIKVTENEATLLGFGKAGLFYSIQSFTQLLDNDSNGYHVPSCIIDDRPVFAWRGMHLDVCRHFFSKEEVKKYIDYLAFYKFNRFHWHLTEDQGWRIEIKKYPELTIKGAYRMGTIIGKQSDTAPYDNIRYGGYYTQEEIKEIVQYASERHVTIVPEIEMPGHSLAALASYPDLSCNGGSFETGKYWGVYDDVFCAGNDSVFNFLQGVLDEVCELFPGTYIHIGGDECPKTRWKSCPKCQARMKAENLKDEHELQSYFISRIEKYLNQKGKQIIGWDEILEGGLAPNAAVMSWRGMDGGIAAANQNHNVVMSPGKPCYFDHYQSEEKNKEPLAIGGFNPVSSVYAYSPIPESLKGKKKKFILGAQGNVWTEYITSFSQVEYMTIPRVCALSEVLWTKQSRKEYSYFLERMRAHKVFLDKQKINYAKHIFN